MFLYPAKLINLLKDSVYFKSRCVWFCVCVSYMLHAFLGRLDTLVGVHTLFEDCLRVKTWLWGQGLVRVGEWLELHLWLVIVFC